MTYLGYSILIRRTASYNGVEADIVGQNGSHLLFAELDRASAEASAREIVDYATRKGLALDIAAVRVLA